MLLGYSANDPPVRYLLEGLHSRSDGRIQNIFAFERGTPDEVSARWRDLGVRALPYPKRDDGHADLWETLREWAHRRDDPALWRQRVAILAQGGPRSLQAHQRGQVASLVRTEEGARVFSSIDPPPPAEWICVFDRSVRLAEPTIDEDVTTDPSVLYGLDDDPPRPEPSEERGGSAQRRGDDLISIAAGDERADRHKRLAGTHPRFSDSLPPRLMHLSAWFSQAATQPAAIWWIANYDAVHPQLLEDIERRLDRSVGISEFGRSAWALLLERFRHSPLRHEDGWFPFTRRVQREGWTSHVFRDFDRAIQPHLGVSRRWRARLPPSSGDGDSVRLRDLVDFKVEYPGHERDRLNVPAEHLSAVFRLARRALQRAAQLLADIDTKYWHTASFIPDDERGTHHANDASKYFNWIRDLFDALSATDREAARREVRGWPKDETYFFNKLTIYAWMNVSVLTGSEVATEIMGLSQDSFWEEYYRRELLHMLRARWTQFDEGDRRRIEERIIAGDTRWETEEQTDYENRVRRTAGLMLGWLENNGCELSRDTSALLPKLRAAIPGWTPDRDQFADHSLNGGALWIATNTDPSALLTTPLSEIVPLARRLSGRQQTRFVEHAPFRGLVEQRPRRALGALRHEQRKGSTHADLWRTLLAFWPESVSDRPLRLCVDRLARLGPVTLGELRYDAPRWFEKNAVRIAAKNSECAFKLFDTIADGVVALGEDGSSSAMGEVSIGGKVVPRSRRTYEHTINSPIGQIAGALTSILSDRKLTAGSGIPQDIAQRLERLLAMPGEGADHAACEISLNLVWLNHVDPIWAREHIVPMLDIKHPLAEPAWNGFLRARRMPRSELFAAIKPHFIEVFRVASEWKWESDSAYNPLVEYLIVACHWKQKAKRYVSFDEARVLLRLVDAPARAHAVWFIANDNRELSWNKFGRHFFRQAWPREIQFRAPEVSTQLAFLAERSGADFPNVVDTILPFLGPADQLDATIHSMNDADDATPAAAVRFPEATLALLNGLIADHPNYLPYGLFGVLQTIAENAPPLRADERWKRLNKIARGGDGA